MVPQDSQSRPGVDDCGYRDFDTKMVMDLNNPIYLFKHIDRQIDV